MEFNKRDFMKAVTVIHDTREQKNGHIIATLSDMGIMTEQRKLDFGDYSFTAEGRDFSLSCVIERKANVDEIYNNIMHDRERLEKELKAAMCLSRDFTLLIENISSWEALKLYGVPERNIMKHPERKVQTIGAHVYAVLKEWKPANGYNFNVEFVEDNKKTAAKMLEIFYYYWYNFKTLTAARR